MKTQAELRKDEVAHSFSLFSARISLRNLCQFVISDDYLQRKQETSMCGGDRWQIPAPHDSKHSWFSQSLLRVVVRKTYVNMSCRATAQPPQLQVPFLTTASALLPQLIDGGEFAGSKRPWLMSATPPIKRHFNGSNRLVRLGQASTVDFLIWMVRVMKKAAD